MLQKPHLNQFPLSRAHFIRYIWWAKPICFSFKQFVGVCVCVFTKSIWLTSKATKNRIRETQKWSWERVRRMEEHVHSLNITFTGICCFLLQVEGDGRRGLKVQLLDYLLETLQCNFSHFSEDAVTASADIKLCPEDGSRKLCISKAWGNGGCGRKLLSFIVLNNILYFNFYILNKEFVKKSAKEILSVCVSVPSSFFAEFKVYKRRWAVLILFAFYSASNSMQWIQYSIINNIVSR